jgi:3-keto-disaccharide hydrolase
MRVLHRHLVMAALSIAAASVYAQSGTPPNTLSASEKAAGWILLFDGKTTAGWRGFHSDKFPETGWVVENGAIKTTGSGPSGGDIITVAEFDNFELQLEWKIGPGGNTGVKYLISEDLIKTGRSGLGFEMQVIDDELNADAKAGKDGNRTAGGLYDLIAPVKNKTLHPVGEWNQAGVRVLGNHVEHFLNGGKVLEFEMFSPEFKARIADSKFKVNPGFGEVKKGHVLLQAHGAEVWFRNIKIRELKVN